MNRNTAAGSSFLVYTAAILGTFLLLFFLVRTMKHTISPPPITQQRADERRKALTDLRATSADSLNNYGWQDQSKKIVRLPIERAMQLVLEEWKNPTAGRTNLIGRMEFATALPPKEPEKPSPLE
jgi:hypothetical protein